MLAAAGAGGDRGTSPVAGWGWAEPPFKATGALRAWELQVWFPLLMREHEGGGLIRGSGVSLQMWVLSARHCLVPPPARAACPTALLPLCPATHWRARQLQPMGDSAGRLQQREGSCITIRYNLSPFLLPSSAGDGYCLIPFDSSFIICLPPSSFPWLLQGSFVAVIKAW